jgi:hypothetical protein
MAGGRKAPLQIEALQDPVASIGTEASGIRCSTSPARPWIRRRWLRDATALPPVGHRERTMPENENTDRQELKRRLEQARRMVAGIGDPITVERLNLLIQELEKQLR